MAIRAVVFDIGGVLELDVIETMDSGLDARWEQRLGLQPGELNQRMEAVWRAGSLGEVYGGGGASGDRETPGYEPGADRGVYA